MRFEFATATRIIFGPGTLREVGPIAAGMGSRALVVTGRTSGCAKPLLDLLTAQGRDQHLFRLWRANHRSSTAGTLTMSCSQQFQF